MEREIGRTKNQTSNNHGGEREKVASLGLSVHVHAEPVAAKCVAPEFEEVIEAALDVYVIGARNFAVFVDLENLAGVAAAPHFVDHQLQMNGPTTQRRGIVANVQNFGCALHRTLSARTGELPAAIPRFSSNVSL